MNYKIIIKAKAEFDIEDAIIWYNNQQNGLGKIFYTELEKKITRIAENPLLFAVRYAEILRMTLLRSFPYAIHYIIDENDRKVFILRVLHHKKDSGNWPEIEKK